MTNSPEPEVESRAESRLPQPPVVEAALEAWAEAGRLSRAPVEGTSMWPLLRPGEVAIVAHGRQHLRPGDLLAYRVGDRVVIHRLLRRRPDSTLLLAGDNRPLPDAPVPPAAVLGRVVAVEHAGGRFGLESTGARALGWALAVTFPLRRRRGFRRATVWLRTLAGWLLRRRVGRLEDWKTSRT